MTANAIFRLSGRSKAIRSEVAGSAARQRRTPGKPAVSAVAKVDSWRDPRDRPVRLVGDKNRNADDMPLVLQRYTGPDQDLAAALERCAYVQPYKCTSGTISQVETLLCHLC